MQKRHAHQDPPTAEIRALRCQVQKQINKFKQKDKSSCTEIHHIRRSPIVLRII